MSADVPGFRIPLNEKRYDRVACGSDQNSWDIVIDDEPRNRPRST
jgi:hypothetical protein